MIGCSVGTIRGWERKGKLIARKAFRYHDNGGCYEQTVYDPQELARMPRRPRVAGIPGDEGELAARAYELFDHGASIREAVKALRQTPAKVTSLHDSWLVDGGRDVVLIPQAIAQLVEIVGPFDGVAGLVERVGAIAGRASGPDKLWLVTLHDKEIHGEPDIGLAIVEAGDEIAARGIGREMEAELRAADRRRCVATIREVERDRSYRIGALFRLPPTTTAVERTDDSTSSPDVSTGLRGDPG